MFFLPQTLAGSLKLQDFAWSAGISREGRRSPPSSGPSDSLFRPLGLGWSDSASPGRRRGGGLSWAWGLCVWTR